MTTNGLTARSAGDAGDRGSRDPCRSEGCGGSVGGPKTVVGRGLVSDDLLLIGVVVVLAVVLDGWRPTAPVPLTAGSLGRIAPRPADPRDARSRSRARNASAWSTYCWIRPRSRDRASPFPSYMTATRRSEMPSMKLLSAVSMLPAVSCACAWTRTARARPRLSGPKKCGRSTKGCAKKSSKEILRSGDRSRRRSRRCWHSGLTGGSAGNSIGSKEWILASSSGWVAE